MHLAQGLRSAVGVVALAVACGSPADRVQPAPRDDVRLQGVTIEAFADDRCAWVIAAPTAEMPGLSATGTLSFGSPARVWSAPQGSPQPERCPSLR